MGLHVLRRAIDRPSRSAPIGQDWQADRPKTRLDTRTASSTQAVPSMINRWQPEIQSDHHHLPGMTEAFDPEDFSFVVKMRGAPAKPWVWEIHRAGKSGPVERSPAYYASVAEAVREGKKALARILSKAAA